MVALMIDYELIQNIAGSMFNKTSIFFTNDIIPLHDDLKLLFRWFMDECANSQVGSNFILETLSTQIIVTLLRRGKSNKPSSEHN